MQAPNGRGEILRGAGFGIPLPAAAVQCVNSEILHGWFGDSPGFRSHWANTLWHITTVPSSVPVSFAADKEGNMAWAFPGQLFLLLTAAVVIFIKQYWSVCMELNPRIGGLHKQYIKCQVPERKFSIFQTKIRLYPPRNSHMAWLYWKIAGTAWLCLLGEGPKNYFLL